MQFVKVGCKGYRIEKRMVEKGFGGVDRRQVVEVFLGGEGKRDVCCFILEQKLGEKY